MTTASKPILVTALGGNALIKKGQRGTVEEQFANLRLPMLQLAALSRTHRLVVTHGNGPQVGNLLLQQECCADAPSLPLEILVAQTEGQIGYMLESTLDEELTAIGLDGTPLVSLLTYVVVDANDPALAAPTKPIGPVLDPNKPYPFPVRQTAKGPRRVVGSPEPVTIIERKEIRTLIEQHFIVICCGGGGIPVTRARRGFQGVDAVIDKDLVSALLAREVHADLFVIASDVPGAYLDYGTEREKLLGEVTVAEIKRHMQDGQFPPGSMLPKVEACVRFAEATGKPGVICALDQIKDAVLGKAGTRVVAG